MKTYSLIWTHAKSTEQVEDDKPYFIGGAWQMTFVDIQELMAELQRRLENDNPKNYDLHEYIVTIQGN